MRILLDESLPRKLALELTGHETQTVQKRGWSGLKNGVLLRTASQEFQVLLTGDQNLEFQQNPATLPISVIILVADNNRIETLRPLVPRVLEALKSIRPGQLVHVGGPGRWVAKVSGETGYHLWPCTIRPTPVISSPGSISRPTA